MINNERNLTGEFEELVLALRQRFDKRNYWSEYEQDRFLSFLKNLSLFHAEPMDYLEDTAAVFPDELSVAYAICHPECGWKGCIVDETTQICMACGGNMFVTESQPYRKVG